MKVIVYQHEKSAMQSGHAGDHVWCVDALDEGLDVHFQEPVMQWRGTRATQSQVRLTFASREDALSYCKAQGWSVVQQVEHRSMGSQPKSYADNFTKGYRY